MSGKIEVDEAQMSQIIASAVLLRLSPEVRNALISKAIEEYRLAPRDIYGKTTRLQYQVNEAIDARGA